jgi:hypothetical protein
MSKLTAFAIGLLTMVSTIAPSAQALQANVYSPHSIANVPVIGSNRSNFGRYHRYNRARYRSQQTRQHRRYGYRSLRNHSYDLGRRNRSNGYYNSNYGRVTEHRDRQNHRGSYRVYN